VPTQLMASRVRSGLGLPDVCSRHGRHATRRSRAVIESSPPGWVYATIPAGLLIFLILRAALRKSIVAPAWPFCDRCQRRRATVIAIASVVVVVGLGMVPIGLQLSHGDPMFGLFGGLGVVIAMCGYAGFALARPAAIAGARLTQDGLCVVLEHPNDTFVTLLGAEQPAARQHDHGVSGR